VGGGVDGDDVGGPSARWALPVTVVCLLWDVEGGEPAGFAGYVEAVGRRGRRARTSGSWSGPG